MAVAVVIASGSVRLFDGPSALVHVRISSLVLSCVLCCSLCTSFCLLFVSIGTTLAVSALTDQLHAAAATVALSHYGRGWQPSRTVLDWGLARWRIRQLLRSLFAPAVAGLPAPCFDVQTPEARVETGRQTSRVDKLISTSILATFDISLLSYVCPLVRRIEICIVVAVVRTQLTLVVSVRRHIAPLKTVA